MKNEGNLNMKSLEHLLLSTVISASLLTATALVGCQQGDKLSGPTFHGPTLSSVTYGNGSGYGGTQTLAGLTFYRLDSSYSCAQTGGVSVRSYHSAIYFPTSYSPYAVLRGDSCNNTETTLCPTGSSCPESLELPPAYYPAGTRSLIGYQEAIYELRESVPRLDSSPEQFVESWCRSTDAGIDEGIDVIVRADINHTNQRWATIVISRAPTVSDGGGHLVEPFTVTKTEGGYGRTYETQAFSLTIDLDVGSLVPYKHPGKLKATIDGKLIEAEVNCRTVS